MLQRGCVCGACCYTVGIWAVLMATLSIFNCFQSVIDMMHERCNLPLISISHCMTDPELTVLDVLVATCQQTRRLNPSADVAAIVLKWERRLVADREKRQAAISAAAAPVDSAEGAGREAALAA